jgi:hypothetical protein
LLEALANPAVTANIRQRLLGEMRNIELRQKYLGTRTSDWAAADLRMACERLLAARIVRGVMGLALVGATGAAIGDLIVAWTAKNPGAVAVPVLVGMGSMISGAISFALLAAMGYVVMGELVGEFKPCRSGRGVRAMFGQVVEVSTESACGAIWGAICGLAIGALACIADLMPRIGTLDLVIVGAVSGAMLGFIFAVLLLAAADRNGGSSQTLVWAALGPLPFHTYFFSVSMAHRQFLGK